MIPRLRQFSAPSVSLWCSLFATMCTDSADVARADAPDIKALVPSGVQRGQTATVKVLGKAGTAPVQAWCDREQVTITVNEKGDELTVTAAPETPTGLCWIRLYNAEGASALRPFFIGLLPEVSEEEPNNSLPQAKTVDSAGVTINGVLHKGGEVDVFAVSLEAGQTLVASVESARTLASPADCVLQVLSPQGFVLEQNDDDHGIDPQIVFQVPESVRRGSPDLAASADRKPHDPAGRPAVDDVDGSGDPSTTREPTTPAPDAQTYYIRLFAFPKDPNSTIGFAGGDDYVYRLTLTTGPFIDRLVPAAAAEGSTSTPRGWNLPDNEAGVTLIEQSERVTGDLPFVGAWQMERMPIATGTLIVEPDNVTDPLELPVAVTGHITADAEVDSYRFRATKGQSLRIAVTARGFDSPLDAVLRILDADGKVLKEEDDTGRDNFDPATTLDVPADGVYTAQVTDRFGHGGERYFYLMSIGPVQPDVVLSVEKDAWVLKPGTPLEIPVTVARTGTLPGELEISVDGLPEGITMTVGETAAKPPEGERRGRRGRRGASAGEKTTLKLEAAEGTVFSGPLKIVGTVDGETTWLRTATAPTVSAGLKTRDLWLTVAPAK